MGAAPMRRAVILVGGLIFSAFCGFVGDVLGVPLAWILGPLIGAAIISVCGLPTFSSDRGRRLGQWIIGTGLGLNITAAVAAASLPLVPLMFGCALVAILLAAVVAVAFAAAARVSYPTAYFAMMPGGLSEMANLGARSGAETEPIAVSQSLRVALLVCLFPPVILHFGDTVPASVVLTRVDLDPLHLVSALGMGLCGALLLSALRVRNPWMVGALLGAGVGASVGFLDGRLHPWLFAAGQYLIGITIGARFKRDIIIRLGRIITLSGLGTLLLAITLLGLALVTSHLFAFNFVTLALATAPGGMTELSIAAQLLGLPVAAIIGFHIVRSVLVNSFAEGILTLLHRSGLLRRLDPWLKARAK